MYAVIKDVGICYSSFVGTALWVMWSRLLLPLFHTCAYEKNSVCLSRNCIIEHIFNWHSCFSSEFFRE